MIIGFGTDAWRARRSATGLDAAAEGLPEQAAPAAVPAPVRVAFLDACRGIAVLSMLFANLMNVFLRRVPEVLSHNEGDRLRAFDFPAPVFQFLIGVSLVLFLEKRAGRQPGRDAAQRAAVRRFVLLICLGLLLDTVGSLHAVPKWGVLQTLGLGGVIATGVAFLPDGSVTAVALVLLGVFSGPANGPVHASPFAALAFVPLTLCGLLVGRGLRGGSPRNAFVGRSAATAASALVLAGAGRAAGIPFNKVLGTSSFVALATAVSATTLLSTALGELAGLRFPAWLLAVGSNALTAWVLQYVLVYYPAWLLFPAWHRLAFMPGIMATVAAVGALGTLTVALGRRGIRIPI